VQKRKPNNIYIAAHILIWMLIALLPFVFSGSTVWQKPGFLVSWIFSLIESIGMFYLFYGYIIKQYLKPNRFLKFVLVSISVFICFICLELSVDYLVSLIINSKEKIRFANGLIGKVFVDTFIIGVALFVSLVENWFLSQQFRQEAEREKLESELKMLKFQVNPHFLFNTLNNIHTLVYKKSDKAPEAVLKLSSLMRYMLYETEGDRVSLKRELEYLHNFVELQKLRLTDNQRVSMKIEGNPDGYEIAPLLLIPFIENAFKHGTSTSKSATIEIAFHISNGELIFNCTNDLQPNSVSKSGSGIGLANVKKRLDLIYSGRYRLNIDTNNEKYSLTLSLSL